MARASSDDDGVCAETGGQRIEKYARSGSIADGGVVETRRTREHRSKERPCRSTTCRPRPPFRGNSWHARSRRILRGDGQSNARRLIVGEGNARIMAEWQNATNFLLRVPSHCDHVPPCLCSSRLIISSHLFPLRVVFARSEDRTNFVSGGSERKFRSCGLFVEGIFVQDSVSIDRTVDLEFLF